MSIDSITILKVFVCLPRRSGINNTFLPTMPTFQCNLITLNKKAKDKDFQSSRISSLTKVILNGDSKYSDIQNHILNSTITNILDSKCLDCSLL